MDDFGWWKSPTGWRPILERAPHPRCLRCNGFGSYGNPLAGYLHQCEACDGTGQSKWWIWLKKKFSRKA